MLNPHIDTGVALLRTKWPQSHAVAGKHGQHLIVIPSVILPRGYRETICTVLFIAPPGYPAACPDHFFTDIEIRLENKAFPKNALPVGSNNSPLQHWPQWEGNCQWWSWHLQMWNPNQSSLYTYMNVIRQRLSPAR
jgi:hypothetical protein